MQSLNNNVYNNQQKTVTLDKHVILNKPVTLNLFQGLPCFRSKIVSQNRQMLNQVQHDSPQYKYNLSADTVCFSANKRIEKKKAKQEEQCKKQETLPEKTVINQTVQEEKPEESVFSKLNKTNKTITKIESFLKAVKEKPDEKLSKKDQARLQQAKRLLAEKTLYLQELEEKTNRENEQIKLKAVLANLNKTKNILTARERLNAGTQTPETDVPVVIPEITKTEPAQKRKKPAKQETDVLQQRKEARNLEKQRNVLAKKLVKLNEKLDVIVNFLTKIENKPDNLLNREEKSQLSQVKPLTDKIKRKLEEIEEKNQKEIQIQKTKEKTNQINNALTARIKLNTTETHHKTANPNAWVDLTYKNSLNLKSTPNFSNEDDFKTELGKQVPGIVDTEKASMRVSSLSRYLKEKMIGFEVPEYKLNEEKKGGYHWFERGLENLLIGSKKANLYPDLYQKTSKELFGILSIHDKYWKSPEFGDYLASLKTSPTITESQTKAVDATILAIKELNEPSKIGFGAKEIVSMGERAFTPMKFMPEIYETCAYTGKKLDRSSNDEEFRPSADHIVPHSWNANKNDDGNFIISSMTSNTERGNMPLIKYLKGHSE